MCLDVHGDEALPYIFLAGNEVRCCEMKCGRTPRPLTRHELQFQVWGPVIFASRGFGRKWLVDNFAITHDTEK